MSQIKVQGNASGTGIFTITSPNSNNNQTLTLPDSTGTVLTKSGTYVATSDLGSGTANSSTYLRGDQTWATVTSLPGAQAQVFTGNGTFTIPTGITAIKVTVQGGGGGGGGSTYANCSVGYGGSGGGGGCAITWLTGLTPGNTLSVTVGGAGSAGSSSAGAGGTGGTSSVASGTQTITTISGTGGSGGAGGAGGASQGNGGAGGGTSGGTISFTGQSGRSGLSLQNAGSSTGGHSLFGLGGQQTTASRTVSSVGTGYGAGGTGAGSSNQSNYAGAAGTAGLVIFEW